jgi:hypothetical protein
MKLYDNTDHCIHVISDTSLAAEHGIPDDCIRIPEDEYTVFDALVECLQMWTWLAANPIAEKSEYPGLGVWHSSCPCCEYVKQLHGYTGGESCNSCPLIRLWGGFDWYPCTSDCSPYYIWMCSKYSVNRRVHAETIRDGCITELERLFNEQKS